MRSSPQVSIVLPTYNRPNDVLETLAQIRANVSVPHEVLILDNSDHPTDMKLDAGEHCVFVGRNEGAAARNRGIQCARAPYLLMLDDDSHPLLGSLEAALPILRASPWTVAGLMASVTRLDGSPESTLLPTTLLGCGVLFKSDVLRRLPFAYPHGFCFYGEEYFVTLALYRAGCCLEPCPELKVLHRASDVGRQREKIFYHLPRNNSAVWQKFTPPGYLGQVLEDTNRRYEYIADREGVRAAFDKGISEALTPDWPVMPLPDDRFRAFSLLDRFAAAAERNRQAPGLVLCGTGKFPGLWARELHTRGTGQVALADFNPALIGRSFSGWAVLAPEAAIALGKAGHRLLVGHSSAGDNLRWQRLLAESGLGAGCVIDVMAATADSADEAASQAA